MPAEQSVNNKIPQKVFWIISQVGPENNIPAVTSVASLEWTPFWAPFSWIYSKSNWEYCKRTKQRISFFCLILYWCRLYETIFVWICFIWGFKYRKALKRVLFLFMYLIRCVLLLQLWLIQICSQYGWFQLCSTQTLNIGNID